jgi:ABC-type branched-subunit amino acid transport system ATPase component
VSESGAASLELTDVRVRFGGTVALNGVSLSARRGEVIGLIGPNGAGKTTLFDVISGVRFPDQGTVRLGGREVTRTPAFARARLGLRRTFQRVQTFGWLTVEDNVLAAIEWEGGGGGLLADLCAFPARSRIAARRRARAAEVLDQCGLGSVRGEMAGSLPIGLARMVELARALVAEPAVLLLDEPSSGLGDAEAARLADCIQRVRSGGDCAVVLVEHDVGFVMDQCDRVVVLHLGEVLAAGSPSAIQADDDVRAAYLGTLEAAPISDFRPE